MRRSGGGSGRTIAALVLALAAAATSARAQGDPPQTPPALPIQLPTPSDPFESRVTAAGQLLEADPRAGLEALDHLAVESIELRKTRPVTAAERPAHRQLFVLRARGHLQSLNDEKVAESYLELLRVDPFFNATLSPREQETLDALRTRESGLVEITSSVRDSRVLLDGIDIGSTGDVPVRASLVAGSYQLRLEKLAYQGVGARITIVPGQTLQVTELTPRIQVPPIAFLSDRQGIAVVVDNLPAGETRRIADLKGALTPEEAAAVDQAVKLAGFDPGSSAGFLLRNAPMDRSLSVRFRGECLIEEARTVAVTADALSRLAPGTPLLWFGEAGAVRMRPDIGTLRVVSAPSDADVILDGQMTGRTPFERGVCSGEHRIRVRHRIGSYSVSTTITRGRTEVVDVVLKPGVAFLGAIETVQGMLRASSDLTSTIDRTLASSLKAFRLSPPVELTPEVQRWTDTSTAELIAAADRNDSEIVRKLLRQASDNYDAPLLLGAVARGPAGSADTAVDLLLFWYDHAGVDRIRLVKVTTDSLAAIAEQIDRPLDPMQLVYRNELGIRLADTLLPEAPLLVVSVDTGGQAAQAGIKPGDGVAAVDGMAMTAGQVGDLLRQKKPGEVVNLRLAGPGPQARQVTVPVQRRPQRAPVFDSTVFGNAFIAKMQAASAISTSAADRELLNFNLALAYMRFQEWRRALDLLSGLADVPSGVGVSRAAATYFRARCHLELGERDRGLALLREIATNDTQVMTEDGLSVGAIGRLRLFSLEGTRK